MKRTLTCLILLSIVSVQLWAGDKNATVVVTSVSLQLKKVKDDDGNIVEKWLKATRVVPKTIIKYVNTIHNNSDENISDIKLANPVNKNVFYLADTAKSEQNATIIYSIDNGKSFDEPKNLKIGEGDDERVALAREYNAVEWIIDNIEANSSSSVEFKVEIR